MKQPDYIRDIAAVRSMMERSSKFLSLSGLAGVMAGLYALAGSGVAHYFLRFNPDRMLYNAAEEESLYPVLPKVFFLAAVVLILAVGTAILLSYKKASARREKLWNIATRRLLSDMGVPLITGGLLILFLASMGLIGLLAPFTLLFYGMALYNAGKFTYGEIRSLGLIEIGLGLISICFIRYGLLFWTVGFGALHIIYGIYMHYKYDR